MSVSASSSAEVSDGIEDLWLFGYGSLIWKPPPHADKRVPGYVEGYVRRFWQASEDHRGTPEAPGRVVTLIEREYWESLTDQHARAPPKVWGAAYRIPARHVSEVKEYLDIREINGYSVHYAPFHVPASYSSHKDHADRDNADKTASAPASVSAAANAPISCLVYIGLPTNPQFLGAQDPAKLAAHIARSRGPSGENTEYLYNLAAALDDLRREARISDADAEEIDEHVVDLAKRVRREEALMREKGERKPWE